VADRVADKDRVADREPGSLEAPERDVDVARAAAWVAQVSVSVRSAVIGRPTVPAFRALKNVARAVVEPWSARAPLTTRRSRAAERPRKRIPEL